MALAPPPGTILRSRCFRMSTGASRETREISPKTNSSATRSPSTATVRRGKASTIFARRCCVVVSVFGLVFMRIYRPTSAKSGQMWGTETFFIQMWGTERSLKFQIVSRGAGDARINLGEDGVHNGFGVFQLQLHRNNVKRLQALGQRAEIDGVFFGSDEATGSRLLTSALQPAHIIFGIEMMVGESDLCQRLQAGLAQVAKEAPRPGYAAERHLPRGRVGDAYSAPRLPDQFVRGRVEIHAFIHQHDGVGALEGAQRLAQPAHGKQTVLEIAGGEQHDVEIALQAAMLKTIVEQMELRPQHLLGELAGEKAVFADDNRNLQFPRDEQRLVAKIGRMGFGIDHQTAPAAAAIAAREHVERNAAPLQ